MNKAHTWQSTTIENIKRDFFSTIYFIVHSSFICFFALENISNTSNPRPLFLWIPIWVSSMWQFGSWLSKKPLKKILFLKIMNCIYTNQKKHKIEDVLTDIKRFLLTRWSPAGHSYSMSVVFNLPTVVRNHASIGSFHYA